MPRNKKNGSKGNEGSETMQTLPPITINQPRKRSFRENT